MRFSAVSVRFEPSLLAAVIRVVTQRFTKITVAKESNLSRDWMNILSKQIFNRRISDANSVVSDGIKMDNYSNPIALSYILNRYR